MKKELLILLTLYFCVSTLNATEKIWSGSSLLEKSSNQNCFEGPCTFTYKNGNKESEGSYHKGKKDDLWKYWFENGQECREATFKEGQMIGNIILWSEDGHKTEVGGFYEKIKSYLPSDSSLDQIIAYLADMNQDGHYEIVIDARDREEGLDNQGQSMLMILNKNGSLLTEKPINICGNDDIIIGSLGKGMPSCIGQLTSCALSAGVCEWRYFVWIHGQIKEVLESTGWYGKSGPFTLPKFADVDQGGTKEVVTDNGTFKWDDTHETFASKNGHLFDFSKNDNYKWVSSEEEKENDISKSEKYVQLGKESVKKNNFGLAINDYVLATYANPDNYEAWELLGYSYIRNQSPAFECLQPLLRSIKIKPDYIMGHYNLALAYWVNHMEKNCFEEIAKVIELNSSYKKIIYSDPQFTKILKSDSFKAWETQQKSGQK